LWSAFGLLLLFCEVITVGRHAAIGSAGRGDTLTYLGRLVGASARYRGRSTATITEGNSGRALASRPVPTRVVLQGQI